MRKEKTDLSIYGIDSYIHIFLSILQKNIPSIKLLSSFEIRKETK